MNTPSKITILCEFGRGFTVLASNYMGEIQCAESLPYDEMLGTIARACCPAFSDGSPNRSIGNPLFLTAPKQQS